MNCANALLTGVIRSYCAKASAGFDSPRVDQRRTRRSRLHSSRCSSPSYLSASSRRSPSLGSPTSPRRGLDRRRYHRHRLELDPDHHRWHRRWCADVHVFVGSTRIVLGRRDNRRIDSGTQCARYTSVPWFVRQLDRGVLLEQRPLRLLRTVVNGGTTDTGLRSLRARPRRRKMARPRSQDHDHCPDESHSDITTFVSISP